MSKITDLSRSVGDRFAKIRESLGNMDQVEFYDTYICDVIDNNITNPQAKRNYISSLENGKYKPSLEILQLYSKLGNTSIDSIINGEDFTPRNTNNLIDPNYKLKNMGELLSVMFFLTEILPFFKVSIEPKGDDFDSFGITAAFQFSYSIKEFMNTVGMDNISGDHNAYDTDECTLKALAIAILKMLKEIKWDTLEIKYDDIKESFISEGSKINLNKLYSNNGASEKFFIKKLLNQINNFDAEYLLGLKTITYEKAKKEMLKLYGLD